MLILTLCDQYANHGDHEVRIITPSGEVIWLNVLGITHGKVRLGFKAHPSVGIMRGELVRAEEDKKRQREQS